MTGTARTPAGIAVGVFPVAVDAAAVAGLAAALGRGAASGPGRAVPMTFPLRWLSDPAIRAALWAAVLPGTADAKALPVHIEQRIALSEPLRIGAAYHLALWVQPPDARRIARVRATLRDARGRDVGSMETGFLLVSAPVGEAP